MAKITVIGSFVMDNVARMTKFSEPGETVLGKSLELFPGGKGANQCISIARLGGDVEMIGMLGKDDNARVFREILKNDNIKSDNVFSCDKPTAVAQVQIDDNGQNRICVIPSANYEFGFEELDKIDNVLRNTDYVVLQLELQKDVTFEIVRRAHKYGAKVVLNPAPAIKIEKDILSIVDYLTPNETELSILSGKPTESNEEVIEACKVLLGIGTKTIVATLGGRGALIANNEIITIVPGYKVSVVDTVAAGDSFNGALVVALSEGKSLVEAVKFANAMGALTIQTKGAIPSLRYRKEVEEFIQKNN